MQYFKHMSNMRHDIKLKRLINKYGLEGYGLYCLIIESITENLTTQSPMPDLQESCADIAEFYNGDTTRVNEMACYMVNQGLLELDETTQRIACHKLYKFLEASQTRSNEIRNMIKNYKDGIKSIESEMSVTVLDKSEEENRKEKNIVSVKKAVYGELNNVRLTDDEYIRLNKDYGNIIVNNYINRVSLWDKIDLPENRNRDHNRTIRAWINRDGVEKAKPKDNRYDEFGKLKPEHEPKIKANLEAWK